MQGQQPAQQDDPMVAINSFINQCVSSPNGQQIFNQFVSQHPEAQSALAMMQQYGGGDMKTGFLNCAAAQGKQVLAQQILQKLGLA